jgi:hypothetical protein
LRGDHDLNEIKAQKIVGEFRFARDDEIVEKPSAASPATSARSNGVDHRFCRS